jgi:UDP-2,4-diacetamido-2,4,6-trideoxy-beta-L-altropyranose hydrolase
MRIVFRVDASLKMGTGHVMRCLTIANEFKLQSHEIFFICRELPGNLIPLIKFPVLVLPNNEAFQADDLYLNWLGASQEQDFEHTIKVIPKNIDLLIVDNYALDEIWHKKLRRFS